MKTTAVVLENTNQPLSLLDLDAPQVLPGQVLVRMAYSGVCHSQLMEIQGQRGEDRFLPHLLGHEGTGVVVETGLGVTKVLPGDRVVLTWIKGAGANCSGARYQSGNRVINSGAVTTFSTCTIVSENRCVRLPDGVPMDIGCLFGCALPTGAGIVLNTVRPTPNSSLVVFGMGGVGLSALLGARLSGCAPLIAVDVEDAKLALARDLGAHHVIDARTGDPVEAVRGLTGGEGTDYAVEAAGRTTTIEQAFSCVKKKGGLCVFASHPPFGQRIQLDPYDLICGRQIRGSWGGDSIPDEDVPKFARFYREGRLPLEKLITHRLPLDRINEAFQLLESGQAARVLIEIDPTI
ncbi:MAG: zinc-binding dehydrogenase [bacterium]